MRKAATNKPDVRWVMIMLEIVEMIGRLSLHIFGQEGQSKQMHHIPSI